MAQPAGSTQRRRRDGRPVEEPPPTPTTAPPPPTGLGAVGLTAAVLGPALAGAAAGGVLVDVASLPSAQAITLSAAAILQSFERFLDARELVTEADVGELLEDEYGDVDEDVRLEVVDREVLFDRAYRGKARARLDRDLPSILAIADEETRREELRKLLDRERRFAEQREEAIAVRSMGSVEARVVEAASPEGAYWALSDNVERHTPDCLAMGGKVWPWTVLRNFHPPLHTGCACELRPVAAAVKLLGRAPDMPSPELAFAAMAVQEARWDPADVMWVENDVQYDEGLNVLEADQRRWARGTTHGGQFRPRRGGNPGRPVGARMRVRKRRGDLLDMPDADARPARGEAPPRIAKKMGRELQVGDEVLAGGQWHRVDGIDPKVPGSVVLDTIGRALLDPDTHFDVRAAHAPGGGGETDKTPDHGQLPGIERDLAEAGFADAGEARAEIAMLRDMPDQWRDRPYVELLGLRDTFQRQLRRAMDDAGIKAGTLEAGKPTDHEQVEKWRGQIAKISAVIDARKKAAVFQRRRQAIAEGKRTGKLTITAEERREVLGTKRGDAYRDAGLLHPGEPEPGYTPEVFRTSDLTGAKVRHYVELPDGRIAHPDELHEAVQRGRIIVAEDLPRPDDEKQFRSELLPADARRMLEAQAEPGAGAPAPATSARGQELLEALRERPTDRETTSHWNSEPVMRAAEVLGRMDVGETVEAGNLHVRREQHGWIVRTRTGVAVKVDAENAAGIAAMSDPEAPKTHALDDVDPKVLREYEDTLLENEWAQKRWLEASGLTSAKDRGDLAGYRFDWRAKLRALDLSEDDLTAERVGELREEQRAATERFRAAQTAMYRDLLSRGQAFEIVDHTDRLKTKPWQVSPRGDTVGVLGGDAFLRDSGANLRLSRFGSREAAEKALGDLNKRELERLGAPASSGDDVLDRLETVDRHGLEAPYHRGGMRGLPRLPDPSEDDRFELRFRDGDAALVMWDRRENKPYAVWEKDWNLEVVQTALDEQNAATRVRAQDPPPAPKGIDELGPLLRGKQPASAGEIVPGFEFTGETGRAQSEDGVLKLPVGFFKQSKAVREGVVFRHLGRRLYTTMDDEDLRDFTAFPRGVDVPGTYAALNSPALMGKLKALEPERGAFVARMARKHGLPLSPAADAWLSERGVELEGDVHAGATGVEATPDPPALVDARALAAELNGDSLLRLRWAYEASERGYSRIVGNDDGSAVYRNIESGITLDVPLAGQGEATATLDQVPLERELADRLEGRGEDALTELAARDGWLWTRAGGGRGNGTWHRLVHPDGRAFEIYAAGNGYLSTQRHEGSGLGGAFAFTPPAKLVDDARIIRLRSRPAETIKAGDAFLGGDVSMEQQLGKGGWTLETQTMHGQSFRSGVPGSVQTVQPWQQPQIHPDATEVRRYRRGPDALVVQLKDGQVVKAGYGDPDPRQHPGKVISAGEYEAAKLALESRRQEEEAREAREAGADRAGGEAAVQGLSDWLKSIEGRKPKRGEQPPKTVMDALLRPGGTSRKTNDTVVMLRDAGWAVTSRTVQRRKGTVFYRLRGKDGSTLEVRGGITYSDPNVTSVKVIPNPQSAIGRQRLERGAVWQNADELYSDALGRADELAERFGAVSDVTSVYDGPTGKALAHHEWNGTIVMSTNNRFRQRFESYLEKRRSGSLSDRDHWDFYDAMSTLQHEVGHGVHTGRPLKPSEYRAGHDIAMEESLNEESARLLTLDWLRAQGMTDTLEAVKRMPKHDHRYIGSYTAYRAKLARLFDEAGVAPDYETRRDLIYRMKFQMSTTDRNRLLDEQILERDTDGDHRKRAEGTNRALDRQLEALRARGAPAETLEKAQADAERQRYSPTKVIMGGSTKNFGGYGPSGFQPIVDDPLADVTYVPTPGELASVGDVVKFSYRGQEYQGVVTVRRTQDRIGGGQNRTVVIEAGANKFDGIDDSHITEIVGGDHPAKRDPARGDAVLLSSGKAAMVGTVVEVRVTGDTGEPEWVEGRVVDLMGSDLKVEIDGMALWRSADRIR